MKKDFTNFYNIRWPILQIRQDGFPERATAQISEENAEIDGNQRENVHHLWEELRPPHLQPSLLLHSVQYSWRGTI